MTDTALAPARASPPAGVRRGSRLDPAMLVWIAFAAILIVIVVNPIFRLVWESVAKEGGGLTLQNYVDAYGRWRYIQSLLNTLVMGIGTASLAILLGVPLAWACVRTDMPGRGFVRLCVLAAFIIPPYLAAVGWVLLAGPNAGWLNKAWMWATGAKAGIFNVYTVWGLIIVMGLHLFFFVFVFTSSALELVSSEMEDAANVLGAGPVKTAFRVTLPLILPAIIGAFIIVFLQSIALFGVPAIIAIPARYPVVTTQLQEFFSSNNRVDLAAAYAIPLLLITVAMLGFQRWLLARKGFTVVGGKGGERRIVRLGKWRYVMLGYALLVALLAVFMPLLVLIQAAFSQAWSRGLSLDNLTLHHVKFILFQHETAVPSLVRSIVYAGAAAFCALGLALVIAYIVKRELLRFGQVLGFLCMAPFVIPGIILAIGFYAAYAPPPLLLAGTDIIIVAFTTRLLPIAYQNSTAGLASIHVEMEEAVRILGAGRLTAVRRVVAPLLKRSLIGAWILIFVPACQELSTAIFLSGPGNRVLSVLIFDFSEEGRFEQLAVLGGLLLVITVVIVAIGFRLVGRDFMLRRQ